MLAGFIRVIGGRTLGVHVKVIMINRRLPGIVHKGRSVPDAVSFIDEHMIHLHREEYIQSRLPGLVINIAADTKRFCTYCIIFDDIQTGFLY